MYVAPVQPLRPPQAGSGAGRRRRAVALGLIVAICVPAVIAGNATLVSVQPGIADAIYSLPGFPEDRYGMEPDERSRLAREGVRAVMPLGEGTSILGEARLRSGEPAFTAGEVEHMGDVRGLVRGIAAVWLAALAALALAALALRRSGDGDLARRGARNGAAATVIAVGAAGLAMLLDFGAVFESFHDLFFSPGSWAFAADRTLIRLYPNAFWTAGAAAVAGLALAQTLAILVALGPVTRGDQRSP